MQLAEARAVIAERVAALLNDSLAPIADDAQLPAWSRGLDAGHSSAANALWGQFEKTARALTAPIPELVLPANSNRATVEPSIPGARPGGRTLGEMGDPTLDGWRDAVLAGKPIKPRQWKAVFVAGDWTTEGGGSGILPPRFRR
ncbi:MAG: hypothetical protein IPK16_30930 [Anaerolineales bacterium]|nr:hypothetical protein [Anaerolineales bacterium]